MSMLVRFVHSSPQHPTSNCSPNHLRLCWQQKLYSRSLFTPSPECLQPSWSLMLLGCAGCSVAPLLSLPTIP
eukprot:1160963-Pelagomonas_calceolata.AAC.15